MFILINAATITTIPSAATIVIAIVTIAVFQEGSCLTRSRATGFLSCGCIAHVAADIFEIYWFFNQLLISAAHSQVECGRAIVAAVWDLNDHFTSDANLYEVCVAAKAKIRDITECTSAVYGFVAKVSVNTTRTADG